MDGDKTDFDEVENDGVKEIYNPPPEKSIQEILAADQNDDSLRKYKEALLGIPNLDLNRIVFCKYHFFRKANNLESCYIFAREKYIFVRI